VRRPPAGASTIMRGWLPAKRSTVCRPRTHRGPCPVARPARPRRPSPRPGRGDATAPTRPGRPVGEAEPDQASTTRGSGGLADARAERDVRLTVSLAGAGREPAAPGPAAAEAQILRPIAGEAPTTAAPRQQKHGKTEHPAPRQPGDHQRRRRVGDDRGETGGAVGQAVRPAALARSPPRRDEPARQGEAQ
jgi:hypothetical protein